MDQKEKEKIGLGEMFGDIDSKRYLYESNLQNIFNDYQENIATLDKTKQTALQDAYHIREMSKKYLGEYASNMDIGDVSGNLIDIYGSYQKNLEAIEQNYGELSMNLQQSFQQKRSEALNQLLINEQQFRLEEKSEYAKQVFANLSNEDFGDFDNWRDYLKSEYGEGKLDFEEYQAFQQMMQDERYGEVMSDILLGRIPEGMTVEELVAEEIAQGNFSKSQGNKLILETREYFTERMYNELNRGIESGYFGVKPKLDEEGNVIEGEYEFDTSQKSLYEKYRPYMDKNEYEERIKEAEAYDSMQKEINDRWQDMQPINLKLFSSDGEGKAKYHALFNPKSNVLDQDRDFVDQDSVVFKMGNREYATVKDRLENDEGKPRDVYDEDLDAYYEQVFGSPVTNGSAVNYLGTMYYHKDGSWYRAVSMVSSNNELKLYQSDKFDFEKSSSDLVNLKKDGSIEIDGYTIRHVSNFKDSKGKEMDAYVITGKNEEGKEIQEVYKLSDTKRLGKAKDDPQLELAAKYAEKNIITSKKYRSSRWIFYYQGNYYEYSRGKGNTHYVRMLYKTS